MACNMGEVATVEAWLDSGNHPDDATTFGGTLLVAAAERGGPDMMRMLIARGAMRARPRDGAARSPVETISWTQDAVGPQTPAGIVRPRPLVLAVGARLCRGSGRRSIEGAIPADPVLMVEWLWV